MSSRRLPLPSILAAAAAAAVLAATALPAAAFPGCSDSTPAVSAPEALWDGLQPAASQPFADTTYYNGRQVPNSATPLWSALDVEDGTLFASFSGGFAVYTLGDPANPKKAGMVDVRSAGFLKPITWFSELRDFIYYVDAPRGRSDVAVVAGLQQAGLTVFDTTAKNNPIARYQDSGGQDTGKNFNGVYAAAVGNRLFAFAGVGTNGPGLYAYDLNAALAANGCSENSFSGTQCAGVLQGAIDTSPVGYLSGIDLGGGRHLVATSGMSSAPGVKVWEIVPSAAFGFQAIQRVNTSLPGHGVAVWEQGSKTYLAVRTISAGQIYDISSCMGGSCGSLAGKEVGAALTLGFISGWQSVTFSRAGNRDSGTPHLYFGNDGKCHGMTELSDPIVGDDGRKKEWLYDVSNPASPVEITGNKTLPVDGGKKAAVDYWSFSYARNPSGFSQVMPRMGQFSGDYFYRAGWTIMEAHQRLNLEPTIGIFGPVDGYPGTPQVFTASANNCTPTAGWQWSAGPDATITGTGGSVQIAWSTLGVKTVTATNAGCGNAFDEQLVTILDPAPKIGNVTVSPASATVCQPITFQATGVTGQPPLVRDWSVLPAVTGLQENGDSATWTPGPSDAGTYEGTFTVSGTGLATKSATVNVLPLQALPSAGFAITHDAFTGSKVKLHAAVSGATEWSWDFGSGQFGPFTSDPVAGPHPEHTFSCGQAVCTFDVRVQVRNCEVTTPVVSATLQVVIDNPLEVQSFGALCNANPCAFATGQSINFKVDAIGDPDQYQVDWQGNGSFQAATPTSCPGGGVCLAHTYAAEGKFTPVVKALRDGQASEPFAGSPVSVVKPTTPPPPPPPPPTKSITVVGPTTGSVGQALTYTASASGCTAAANGWSWNTGGGNGSSNTSSISITFTTTGSRTVTATNSGCSGVSGSRTVNIGANQSALAANFTFSPALPKAGDKVTFDAGASTGSPQFYFWKIDGQTIQGKTLEHVFTAPGNHSVTLEVSKEDKSCQLGMCTASTTKTVVVQGDPEPPPPPPVLGNGCAGADAENPELLCLLDGRFRVRVNWVNQHADGEAGVGHSVRSASTGDTTGFFWFFNADNIELLVKMLDGTTVNGHFWFFHGAVSDLFYEIEVEDKVTGASRTYTKLAGPPSAGGDAAAFPATAGAASAATIASPQRLTAGLHQGNGGGGDEGGDEGGGAAESSDHLLLLDGRFEVTVDFLNQHAGDESGLGRAVAGTNNAGYFWFFTQDNLELVVKMIDARPFDGHFWMFWTGLSDLKYNIKVKDLETGELWEFHNPAGKVGGGADTSAFGD